MNFFQLRYRPVAPGEVRREIFSAKFLLLYELTNLLLILHEKISVIIIRILAVTSVFVTRINSRNKRVVIVFGDILLTAVDHQLAEIRERENLAAHNGILNVGLIG